MKRSRAILHFGKKQRDRERMTMAELWQWEWREVDGSKKSLRGETDRTW